MKALFSIKLKATIIGLTISVATLALPGIPGDSCYMAIPVAIGTSCNQVTYSTVGATSDGVSVAPNPSCGVYFGNDIWLAVTVPASGKLRLERTNIGSMNASMAIYTGVCGAFTQIACVENGFGPTVTTYTMNQINMAGVVLYVRVWNRASLVGGSFNLCAYEQDAPVNDLCANATYITPTGECNMQTYTSLFASSDVNAGPIPSCGFYVGADVWFKTTVPLSGHLEIELTSGPGVSMQFAVYTGQCGNMIEMACMQYEPTWTVHSEPFGGTEIYIRVFNFNSTLGGNFNLCIWEPSIPDNDYCDFAIPLTVGTSCSPQTYSNAHCTGYEAPPIPGPSCGLYLGGDAWFTAVVPASGHLRIERTNLSNVNLQYAFYTGNCDSFTEIACASNRTAYTFHDESLAGQTLYIRVYNLANDDGGTFTLCAWEPSIPDNDRCSDAVFIPVMSSCNPVTYSNAYCTSETGVAPGPSCGLYVGSDVWFETIVPASGIVRLEKSHNSSINMMYALYTGTCGNMTEIFCGSNRPTYTFCKPELAGQTLYIRFWNIASFEGGSFQLCLWEAPVPAFDKCENAEQLNVSESCNTQIYSNAYCTSDSDPLPSCGFYLAGDAWFTFTMPLSGHLRIEKNNLSSYNIAFNLYTGTCGNLVEKFCAFNRSTFNIHDESLAGQTIYMRVYSVNNADGGDFSICVWEPTIPDNDFCADAIPLSFGNPCTLLESNSKYCTSEATSVAPVPSCGFYAGADIWYTINVPGDGKFVLNEENVGPTEIETALYSGTCGNFSQIGCYSLQNQIVFNNPAYAGQTIYVRFFPRNNFDGEIFTINLTQGAEACEGDFDASGQVGTTDLLAFLVVYGDPSPCGVYDLSGDNAVSITDFLLFISFFGSVCP